MDYYHISAQELGKGAKLPILKLGDSGEVFYEMAAEMCAAIRANNAAGKPTVFICPVGPVGQYPIFVRLVNREQLSLKNCWFINMDEYTTTTASGSPRKIPCPSGASWPGRYMARSPRSCSCPRSSGSSPIPTTWAASPP